MRTDDEGAGHRHLRVQGLVLEELRGLLRDDVTYPALGDVRVVAVALSVDYRHARAHFVLSGTVSAALRSVERALERATPFLRARLADAIEMKRVPDLRFVFDGAASPEGEGGCAIFRVIYEPERGQRVPVRLWARSNDPSDHPLMALPIAVSRSTAAADHEQRVQQE